MKLTLSLVILALVGSLAWGFQTSRRPVPLRVAVRVTPADSAWYAALPRDPEAATAAFIARVPAEAQARAQALSSSRNVAFALRLITLIATGALLLVSGAAAELSARAAGITRRPVLQHALVGFAVVLLFFLLSLPVETWAAFYRYRHAGLSHSPYGQWLGDDMLNWAVSAAFIVPGMVAIFALIRLRPTSWAGWATIVYFLLGVANTLLAPTYIEPLFNAVTPLADGADKARILSLARANGVPATDVFVRDASRQSVLLNAHVSGIGGHARIVLDDNTLATTPRPEVDMVMSHEIGHYVMGHTVMGLVFDTLVTGAGFLVIAWILRLLARAPGQQWQLAGTSAGSTLTLLFTLVSLWGILMLPLNNAFSRRIEAAADIYGLNASREPFGLAEFMLRDADAGQVDPSSFTEWLFYSHPSARHRILMAMRWRAEQPESRNRRGGVQ